MTEVTVAEEDRLVSEYRAYLRREARRLVAGSPERSGKRFALVAFPHLVPRLVWHCDPEAVKIQWT